MVERHTVNGKLVGLLYHTGAGHRVYLALRRRSDVYRRHNAWCFDTALLERLRRDGVTAVGVLRREGRARLVWLTLLSDLFDSPHSFAHVRGCRQRALPLAQFRVDPGKSPAVIARALRLG